MGYVVSSTCIERARRKEEIANRLKKEFKDSHIKNQELIIEQNNIIIQLLSNDINKDLPQGIKDLIKSQKPLGDDFSKVLYDNLWDLYVE